MEIEGIAKPTAARVMAIAAAGQTLLTAEARAMLGDSSLRVASHGHWHLKGVAEPTEVFEVGDPEAPFTPPTDGEKAYRVVRDGERWVPTRHIPHNLIPERDAFVGRKDDLQALAGRLDSGSRLVSVLGTGGTGKTRLVLSYAWTWLGDWPGGAWFCDLSEARDLDGITTAVARALDVPLGRGESVLQLGHAIAGRGRCLILLDNFEQVARFAEVTLGSWLDRAPQAQFVVTTREVLGLPGESVLALAPLDEADAVSLFATRAKQAKQEFSLTSADLPAVVALVRLLDGLPLAIELAAARIRLMPPATLLGRMSERFRLLTSAGARHTRQATLRATLDWSWDLLSPDEQEALAQLSVFEGGFTAEAAEAVLALSATGAAVAVAALVDKSLVRQAEDGRFSVLVSVHEYAAEKLDQPGGRSAAEARHAAHFSPLGDDASLAALDEHGGVELHAALARELHNFVTGCRRGVLRGSAHEAIPLLCAAWEVLSLQGPHPIGVELATAVLAIPTLDARARARVTGVLGDALLKSGRSHEARPHFDAALRLAREANDPRGEGIAVGNLGLVSRAQGRLDEARAHFHAAIALHRSVGNRHLEAAFIANLGALHADQGQLEEAQACYQEALDRHRAVGHRRSEAIALGNLGGLQTARGRPREAKAALDLALTVHRQVRNRISEGNVLVRLGNLCLHLGQHEEARAHYETALAVSRAIGSRRLEAMVQGNLGLVHAERGETDEARARYDDALLLHREVGHRRAEGLVLGDLGRLQVALGAEEEALVSYGLGLERLREIGDERSEGRLLGYLGTLYTARNQFPEARSRIDAGVALLRSAADWPELGLLLCARARLEHAAGRVDIAGAALAEALAMVTELGDGCSAELTAEVEKTRTLLVFG